MWLYGVYCFESGGGCAGLLRPEFTIFRHLQYTSVLHDIFKYIFSEYINSKYIIKSLVLDIHYLID